MYLKGTLYIKDSWKNKWHGLIKHGILRFIEVFQKFSKTNYWNILLNTNICWHEPYWNKLVSHGIVRNLWGQPWILKVSLHLIIFNTVNLWHKIMARRNDIGSLQYSLIWKSAWPFTCIKILEYDDVVQKPDES